jgi:cytochrome c551/c552
MSDLSHDRRTRLTAPGRGLPARLVLGGLVLVGAIGPNWYPRGLRSTAGAADAVAFSRDVGPILVRRCLECHSGDAPEGGLSLTDEAALRAGGESGLAVEPGQREASLLWQRIASDEMPPRHPLPDAEKQTLAAWIDAGAAWQGGPLDRFSSTTDARAGRDFWSLAPLADPPPPTTPDAASGTWGRGAIDAFILEGLATAGLRPAPEANARTLVRRLFFDLVGLPPPPDRIDAFAADPSDAAYERLVDELLASPAYGERWGRHWLDVVRFGESDGFERNFARDNAWPYRDWVIAALNADMPYDRFVRMQLVGDLEPGGVEGIAATGFWVAGAHNTVVGGSQRMKLLARQDEIEEVLGTFGQAFLGLTLNCARCHDHKFDPVSQEEYYRFASAISGLGYGERSVAIPEEEQRLAAADGALADLRARLASLDAEARRRAMPRRGGPPPPAPIAAWEFDGDLEDSIGGLHGKPAGNARTEQGALVLDGRSHVVTPALPVGLLSKSLEAWVRLDGLDQRGGAALSVQSRDGAIFDALVFGEREPRRWMPGSNNFLRSGSFGGSDEVEAGDRAVHMVLVYSEDGTITAYRDGAAYGGAVRVAPPQSFLAGETEILFGLRHGPAGGNRFLRGRIERAALYDRALTSAEIAASAAAGGVFTAEVLREALPENDRLERDRLVAAITGAAARREALAARARPRIHSLVPGKGEVVRLLGRGDPDLAGRTVTPGATAALAGLPADFGLAADAMESDRRRRLADWVVHPANPLFARVIVNRIWHHHFGTGLVDTPSDFGFNGGRPSHPELLDHLASGFQRGGQSLKGLHRAIVTSSAYRQSSAPADTDARGPDRDAGNRLLWRGPTRRLEAEAIRDAMLAVAGELDSDGGNRGLPAGGLPFHPVGGPGFRDVSVAFIDGTTYYEPLPAASAATFRRTIYRFTPRGERPPLLDAFDCPDPAVASPRRSVTTTPLQALALLNDEFVFALSDRFARRLEEEAGGDRTAQITLAWRLALGREPDADERPLAEGLAARHGLPALCRGLFNLSSFVVVD